MTSKHGKSRQSMMFNTAAFVIVVLYTLGSTGVSVFTGFGLWSILTVVALGLGGYLFYGAWKAFAALNYSAAFSKGIWSWLWMVIVAVLKLLL